MENILSKSVDELTNLGLPKDGDFWLRFSRGGQPANPSSAMKTDIRPFLDDLNQFERRQRNGWDIPKAKLRVIKLM